jgi:hypothetical protein
MRTFRRRVIRWGGGERNKIGKGDSWLYNLDEGDFSRRGTRKWGRSRGDSSLFEDSGPSPMFPKKWREIRLFSLSIGTRSGARWRQAAREC